MALSISRSFKGLEVNGAYLMISSIIIDYLSASIDVGIYTYASEAIRRESPAEVLVSGSLRISEGFADLVAAMDKANPKAVIYEFIKTLPEYEGAVDN